MRHVSLLALVVAVLPAVTRLASEKTPAPPPAPATEDLVERERIRSTIVAAFDLVWAHPQDRRQSLDDLTQALSSVRELGPAAVPFLLPEVESPSTDRFFFAACALGALGGPEAATALRRAMEVADEEGGPYALTRKIWAGFALGLTGDVEALDLFNAGRHKTAYMELYSYTSALEATALVLAPASLPVLLRQLDRYLQDPGLRADGVYTLKALRRLADPSVRPRCRELIRDPDWKYRRECAEILRALGDEQDLDVMLKLLADSERRVRDSAAAYIEDVKPRGRVQELLAHLETEQVTVIRGRLYRTLADLLGERALAAFRAHAGHPDHVDRMNLVAATARIPGTASLSLLREFLRDVHQNVRIEVVSALSRIGGAAATATLLATLRDENWPVVRAAVEKLAEAGERRAAPRIADLLLNHVLPNYVMDVQPREQVRALGAALVDLSYVEPLGDLRRAAEKMTDRETADFLRGVAKRLAALESRGDDVGAWVAALDDPDGDVRQLAYRRLAILGDDRGIDALARTFERRDDPERLEILRALARAAPARASGLIDRVLLEPEFDLERRRDLRDMAAWTARRIGGRSMIDSLRRSAQRREGRDYVVLVYLAQLAGSEALPTLRDVRIPRTRHLKWYRGFEQDELNWMIAQLSAGRSVARLDRPPEQLAFSG